jgi:DNA repair protein RadC
MIGEPGNGDKGNKGTLQSLISSAILGSMTRNQQGPGGRRRSTKRPEIKKSENEISPPILPPALNQLKLALGGPESLSDLELIELILYLALPEQDGMKIAFELLATFGSYSKAFRASSEELQRIEGLSTNGIATLRLIAAAMVRILRADVIRRPVMSNLPLLMQYLLARYANDEKEKFLCLFLDIRNQIIADDIMAEGTINELHIYPREIIKRCLDLNASAIILVHNHPSRVPLPSQDDIEITNLIKEIAEPLGITLQDHIIIAGTEWYSFREDGTKLNWT